ncbi:MAG: hypothetical protein ACLRFN_01810, partial [Alphaproteobacteria bacterium]
NLYCRTVKRLGNPKKNRPLTGRCKKWLGAACLYRHENATEFTAITRLCEIFLKDYTNAP